MEILDNGQLFIYTDIIVGNVMQGVIGADAPPGIHSSFLFVTVI